MPSASNRVLLDHDEIRQWAEERGARPARVKGTGGRGDPGLIRLDFPGFTGEETLEPITWREWFKAFDQNDLALIVQDRTARGQRSNFNKLVSRETVEAAMQGRRAGRSAAAGRKTAGRKRAAASATRSARSQGASRRTSGGGAGTRTAGTRADKGGSPAGRTSGRTTGSRGTNARSTSGRSTGARSTPSKSARGGGGRSTNARSTRSASTRKTASAPKGTSRPRRATGRT